MRAFLLLAAASLSLAGCRGSYRDDLHTICHAVELSGVENASGLADVAPWLDDHLRTRKGRETLRAIAETGTIEWFREETRAHGVDPCPLIEPMRPPPATNTRTLPTNQEAP